MTPTATFLFFVWFAVGLPSLNSQVTTLYHRGKESSKPNSSGTKTGNLFSPRMDYEEWTPLGRGDPLKNDPTYDYVPPVLERVHYWMDPSKRTPDPPHPQSGVLVLGSRTESTFTTTPRYQPFQSKEPQADSRIDTSLFDPFFKLMDVSQFGINFNSNANNHYRPVHNRIQQRPHYQNKQKTPTPQALQRPPYTMLMPPPPPPAVSQPVTNYITSQATTIPEKLPTRLTTAKVTTPKNTTTVNPTTLANTENAFKAVAISMPEQVGPVEKETEKTTIQTVISTEMMMTTTEESMVLPIVTIFDNQKKQSDERVKLPSTTAKYKPLQNSLIPEGGIHSVKKLNEGISKKKQSEVHYHVKSQPPREAPYESTLRATTAPPVTTTTKIRTLTTDPMFKHYKQPSEPIRGPFYLIIQGHSKVKTYGASKNPINRLLTNNEIKNDEEEKKKSSGKFERKTRRLRYDVLKIDVDDENEIDEEKREEEASVDLTGESDNLESLEETFPKSNGGSSKKRYLGSNHRRKRFAVRRLLQDEDCQEGRNATDRSDNLDLESLIAISDDYDPEDVANILLREEGSPGSGFGNFAVSIFSRSDNDGQEI